MLSWAPLEQPWANLCARYCRFVARHPWPFIVLPVLLTALLSTGIMFRFKVVRGVHFLYAPLDAPWKAEEDVFRRLWAADDNRFYPGKDVLLRKGIYLIVSAKDGGSVLRPRLASELITFLDWLTNSTFTSSSGKFFSYATICLRLPNGECFANEQARFLAEAFAKGHQASKLLNVSYPSYTPTFATEALDLSSTLGGIDVDSMNGIVTGARLWLLMFQLKQSLGLADLSTDFELTLSKNICNGLIPTKELDVFYYHSETFDLELAENAVRVAPRFATTFTILVIFSVLCTFNITWLRIPWAQRAIWFPVVDWVVSKPLLGVAGVLTTLAAIVSASGLLLWLGVTFVDICSVMPFLSLTIGIDDTFLILAAWHETSRKLSVEDRVEAAMRHAAVSISITSLTDALAFLIGAIAPLPAVIYFCYYSCAAICFIYLYSMTIFVAILSVQGRWEQENRNALTHRRTHSIEEAEKHSLWTCLTNLGSRPHCKSSSTSQKALWYQRFFADSYVPFICNPIVQLLAASSFIAYITIAYLGIRNVVVGFDLTNVLTEDSPAKRFIELRTEYFRTEVDKLDVAVLRPPNMGNRSQRAGFLQALSQLESTDCSAGRSGTDFWFFRYQDYFAQLGFGTFTEELDEEDAVFNDNLQPFLLSHPKYAYDVLFHANGSMEAFRMSLQLTNYGNNESVLHCANQIRGICELYRTELDMYTYSPMWNLADQFQVMWPQTCQDLYISIAVMVPISLLMIPQPFCAIAIALSISSIGFGVIGFMTWWSVNLDATSMITIAMSVGFSVDFAAHITYAYMTEATANSYVNPTPFERLRTSLSSVGWPIVQASLSVLLGIATLATVQTYIVQTCFKTVLLVIIFGKEGKFRAH